MTTGVAIVSSLLLWAVLLFVWSQINRLKAKVKALDERTAADTGLLYGLNGSVKLLCARVDALEDAAGTGSRTLRPGHVSRGCSSEGEAMSEKACEAGHVAVAAVPIGLSNGSQLWQLVCAACGVLYSWVSPDAARPAVPPLPMGGEQKRQAVMPKAGCSPTGAEVMRAAGWPPPDPFEPYQGDAQAKPKDPCPKCGTGTLGSGGTIYADGKSIPMIGTCCRDFEGEHLHLHCSCGYRVPRPCADSDGIRLAGVDDGGPGITTPGVEAAFYGRNACPECLAGTHNR